MRWLLAPALLMLAAGPRVEAAPAALEGDALLAQTASAVEAAHHRADERAASDPRGAAEDLAQALELAFPPGDPSRALRADLWARLAQLWLAAGDPARARDEARRGLEEDRAGQPLPQTALLRLREGEALEALRDDAGAVEAYREAIHVAGALIRRHHEPREVP